MARGSMFAGSFAACAGAFALLSGDFHAVPVLHRAQGALRGTIDDARKVAFGQPDRRSGAMTVASVRPRGQNRDVRGASTGDAPRAIALRRLEIPEPAYGATAEYRTVPSGGAETAAAFASAAPRDLRASLDVSGGMAEASSAGAVPVPAEWSGGGADERAVDIRIGAGESAAADAANLRRVAEAVRAAAEDRLGGRLVKTEIRTVAGRQSRRLTIDMPGGRADTLAAAFQMDPETNIAATTPDLAATRMSEVHSSPAMAPKSDRHELIVLSIEAR